jgi:hypothetical protein
MRARRHRHGRIHEHSRADHDVGARDQHRLEPLQLLDRRGSIRVGEETVGAPGRQHAGAHRGALAAVRLQAQDADRGESFALDEIRRAVGRPVIDDDDLVRLVASLEVSDDPLQEGR